MTTMVLTSPASTAACPTMRPPTIPMVPPSWPGIWIPASRSSFKLKTHMRSTSRTMGMTIPVLACATESRKAVGSISV